MIVIITITIIIIIVYYFWSGEVCTAVLEVKIQNMHANACP